MDKSKGGFHPGVVKRIESHRLSRAWLAELRAGMEPDDVVL